MADLGTVGRDATAPRAFYVGESAHALYDATKGRDAMAPRVFYTGAPAISQDAVNFGGAPPETASGGSAWEIPDLGGACHCG